MSLAPDYGLRLMQMGISRAVEITFMDFRFRHLDVVAPGRYCATANTVQEGTEYALTLDFDAKILEQILFHVPDSAATKIRSALIEANGANSVIELPEPVAFSVTATLGPLERAQKEQFIPLIVRKVFPAQNETVLRHANNDLTVLRRNPRFPTLKAQAKAHWKTFRPRMFADLEQTGELDAALEEAVFKTIRTEDALLAEGYPKDGAWETAREHIFLKDEETEEEEESDDQYDFVEEWLANKEREGAIFRLPNGRSVTEEELEAGLEDWQLTDAMVGDVVDGPFIYRDQSTHHQNAIRVVALPNDEIGTETWNGTAWERGGTLGQAVQARAPWQGELAHFVPYDCGREDPPGGSQLLRGRGDAEAEKAGVMPEEAMQETETEVRIFRFCFWTLLLLAVSTILASAGYVYIYPRYSLHWYSRSIWGDLRFLMWWLGWAAITSSLIYRKLRSKKPLSEWFNRLISAAKLALVACIAATAILLCWWVWGEALQDWLPPVQVRSRDSQSEKQPAEQAKPGTTAPVALDPSEVEEVKGASTRPHELTPDAFMQEQKSKQQAKPGTTAPVLQLDPSEVEEEKGTNSEPGDFDAFMQQQKAKASTAGAHPANDSTKRKRAKPKAQTGETQK